MAERLPPPRPSVRDLLADLITVHRSAMDDPRWLTHIELADLMLQALDVEGYTVTRACADCDKPLGDDGYCSGCGDYIPTRSDRATP